MRNGRYFLIYMLFCGLSVSAQNAKKSEENKEEAQQVSMVIDALGKAMVNRDRAALENLTMAELTYGHSGGKIETKNEYIAEVVDGPFDFISITPSDQTILLVGDTAVVRHIFNSEAMNDGKPVTIRIGNMMVLKKQNDHWRVLARQAYKL